MALKTYNPTTPGLRQLALVDRSELYKGKPVKALTGRQVGEGRPQQPRPHHRALPRRRPQADLPHHRLQASQARRCRRTVERLEYDPNRTSFIALITLCRRRAGLHHRAAAPRASATTVVAGVQVDVKPGNAMPLASIPVGTIVHNVETQDRQGRRARALRRRLRADRRPRPGLRLAAPRLGRAAPGSRPVLRHRRRGVEPRPHERFARQGRAATAGSATVRTTAA